MPKRVVPNIDQIDLVNGTIGTREITKTVDHGIQCFACRDSGIISFDDENRAPWGMACICEAGDKLPKYAKRVSYEQWQTLCRVAKTRDEVWATPPKPTPLPIAPEDW
jgi:hypothetical protein